MGRATKRNQITSPEKTAMINPENIRLMKDYLDYLRSTQRSVSTISVYENDLLIAFTFLLEHANNKAFVDIKKRDVVAFQNWLINEHENSAARVRRIKATLSSLSNYIANVLDDEYPDFRNIIHNIESPVLQPVREKSVFTDDELQGLLDRLVAEKDYQRACMLALAMFSGRRKAELILFKTDYFADENVVFGSLYKTPEKIKTKGRGNGKFIYCYTLYHGFKPYLDLWLAERKEKKIKSEWLFPDAVNPNDHIKISTMNSWANKFTGMIGKPFYFHAIRHYYTTHLANAGLPESVIVSILGWDSVEMVRVYNDTPVEEEIGKYFSSEGIVAHSDVGLQHIK